MLYPLHVKRVYAPPAGDDGVRVLVDRLWPRGLKRDPTIIDHWLRDLAPSNELRKWIHADPQRWPEFLDRYEAELRGRPAPLAKMRELCAAGPVTLLFAARDEGRNNAVALRLLLEKLTQ